MFRQNTFKQIILPVFAAALFTLSACSSAPKSTQTTVAIAANPVPVAASPRIKPKGKITKTGEVVLLRGLANIFSQGMDTIGSRLNAKGVDARVYNHGAWNELADDIIRRSKRKEVSYPIIIMGHSLGGNASVQMASYLGERGIPVSYVVAFDPTVTTYAGKKTRRVVNYYLPNGKNRVRRGIGFRGKLSNVNVSNIKDIAHTNVEKNRSLQNKSIATVMKLIKRKPKPRRRRRG